MKKGQEPLKHKVVTFLGREEMEFLDKLGKDALFSTGYKLSYNDILKGLVDLAMDSQMDAKNVHSEKELEEKMLQKIKETLEKIKEGKA
jgi:hypothetical protein